MKCLGCDKDFKDEFEFLKLNSYDIMLDYNRDCFCNNCCKVILKTRKEILENKLINLNSKIDKMK